MLWMKEKHEEPVTLYLVAAIKPKKICINIMIFVYPLNDSECYLYV